MTERTFTVEEVRDAVSRTTCLEGAEDRVIEELTRPKQPVIPEGVLCWGWRDFREAWVPCESDGLGGAFDLQGDAYDTARLTHPDDWAKAPEFAKSRVLYEDGDILWSQFDAHDLVSETGRIYAEGKDGNS